MTSGFVVLGVSYLTTALAGALVVDGARNDFSRDVSSYERARQEAIGLRLLVPVVGPFVAIDPAPSAAAGLGLAVVGLVQATGLALAVGGIAQNVKYRRHVRRRVALRAGGADSTSPGGIAF